MKFVDTVRVRGIAGDGGNGCCSFRREKYIPRGGPDGGNGGAGGDIILRVDSHTDNLVHLYFDPIIRAKKGAHGQGKSKHGRAAGHTYVNVPQGTLVYRLPEAYVPRAPGPGDIDAPEKAPRPEPSALEAVADLTEIGQEFVLCKGGRGGRGNASFKSSVNRAPRQHTEGAPGEDAWFLFEMRMIAFAGLVGFPNAGKSTLIGKLSAAHPKVAPYPFTTLTPVVGVVDLDGYERVTVADIPGLIEGAHDNKGLGHEFLRHVVRCELLVFVVDAAGSEGRDPVEDIRTLRRELDLYDPALTKRPWAIVANKMDLPGAEENFRELRRRFRKPEIIPASAASGEGVDAIKRLLAEAKTRAHAPASMVPR